MSTKRIIALVLALVMVLSLAACGSKQEQAADETVKLPYIPEGEMKIGYTPFILDATYQSTDALMNVVMEAAGATVIPEAAASMAPEDSLNAYEKMISRGAQGIIASSSTPSMVPMVMEMCEEAGVFFVLMGRDIADEEIKKQLLECPYFVGLVANEETNTAKEAFTDMMDLGVKKVCLISGPVGDSSSDAREVGIQQALEGSDVEILSTIREVNSAADMTKAIETFVAAYPDMEGIFVSYTWANGAMPALQTALENAGLAGKVRVGRIDFDPSMGGYLEAGTLDYVYGAQLHSVYSMAVVLLVNAMRGTPLCEEAPFVYLPYHKADTAELANTYTKFFEGDVPVYTTEECKEFFFKFLDDSITFDSVMEIYNSYCIEEVAERHKDLVK